MTYYLKYLKYKNKYLELKNMIAGKGPLDEHKLEVIWIQRQKAEKVYEVNYNKLMPHYSHYCWFSKPTKPGKAAKPSKSKYGDGFFLYRLHDNGAKPFEGHVKIGKYAMWYITENDMDLKNQGTMDPPVDQEFFNNSFKTTFDFPNIGLDKDFDWHHERNCWICNTNPQRTYKLILK